MPQRLVNVIAAHAAFDAALLAIAWFAYPHVHSVAAALVSAQVALVAIWIGLSRAPIRLRVAAAAAAIPGFALVMSLIVTAGVAAAMSNALAAPSSTAVPTMVLSFFLQSAIFQGASLASAAAAMLSLRFWRVRLVRLDIDQSPPGSGFQFSIRQLMILTLAVAVVLALGLQVRRYFDGTVVFSWWFMIPYLLASLFRAAADALLAVWASLTVGRPHGRIAAALAVSAGIGLFWSFFLAGNVISLTLVSVGETATVIATLLIVRSCGYRLARGSAESAADGRPSAGAKDPVAMRSS